MIAAYEFFTARVPFISLSNLSSLWYQAGTLRVWYNEHRAPALL
jgi:hypothetical protein